MRRLYGNAKQQMRERWLFLLLSATSIAVGLLIRSDTGLPPVIAKYAGSIIWGSMVYFVVSLLVPQQTWQWRATVAAVIATATEFSQLLHMEWLDAFRRTTIGVLLLGRYFSFADIACYWAGIVAAVLIERLLFRHSQG